MHKNWIRRDILVNCSFTFSAPVIRPVCTINSGGVMGFAVACSNTFGLVTGEFLLGFGLSEIPKSRWNYADWTTRQKVLSHKIAKMAVKLDDAHQDLSNAIVVASNQMSKRDPLRPYMNVIDDMLTQMFREDPFFKPQGGRVGKMIWTMIQMRNQWQP